jgi:hypothetical protein
LNILQDAPEMLDCILNLLQEIKIPAVAVQISDVNDENKPLNEKQEAGEKKSKKKSTKSTFLSSNTQTTTNAPSNFQNGVSAKSAVQGKPSKLVFQRPLRPNLINLANSFVES